MKTLNELEIKAYLNGDTKTASVLSELMGIAFDFEELKDNGIFTDELQEEMKNLREFFDSCFERLDERHPCPSVTSDYDKSIIFDAIQKGENTK